MNKNPFAKKNKMIRLKAFTFTVLFHFVVLGSAYYGSAGGAPEDLLPDFVKEWIDADDKKEEDKAVKKDRVQA